MDAVQIRNGRAILAAVADYGRTQGWNRGIIRRAARLAIMCAITESNLRVDANPNVPESMSLPHDGVGHDHASVGLYQQQVPMWGTAAQCMDVASSTHKFLRALTLKGQLPPYAGRPLWERVQAVQVSAFPDGSNYRAQRFTSWRFLLRWWNFQTARPR